MSARTALLFRALLPVVWDIVRLHSPGGIFQKPVLGWSQFLTRIFIGVKLFIRVLMIVETVMTVTFDSE